MDPNVKDFNQHFLLSALLSYSNKNIYFSQTTSPGPTPVNALLFWSAHTLLGVFAGGSVARTVRRVEGVSAGCMSWLTSCWCEWAENTHTHTLGLTTARQARRSRETEEQFSFISSSRFHLYDFVKTKGKHTLARKKIERKLYKKLSAYVVILIMGRGKFRDRCTTFVTV